jgi:molecular chaperone HscC
MIAGIDLGTTNSLIGVWRNERAELIPNALQSYLTPSVVGFDESGEVLVGQPAMERMLTHPHLTASVFKRYMGTNRSIKLGKQSFRPEELSSLVLRSLKRDAEELIQEPIVEAVISVPAYFNDAQRRATRTAGELATGVDGKTASWCLASRFGHLVFSQAETNLIRRLQKIRNLPCYTRHILPEASFNALI